MANLIDDLQQGMVSRRRLLELLTGAAGSVTLASAQSGKQTKAPTGIVEPPKLSPANIGGGGRIERDYYREWLKTSKVPMSEGYSLLDAAKAEMQPWPEIGGRGLYLDFSGNVHMDAVIQEIPAGKALEPKRFFYEQIVYVLAGRGYTNVGSSKPNKVSWGEGSMFTVPVNALHRHFNSDPAHPARLLFITTFPFMIQVFGSMGLDQRFEFQLQRSLRRRGGLFHLHRQSAEALGQDQFRQGREGGGGGVVGGARRQQRQHVLRYGRQHRARAAHLGI